MRKSMRIKIKGTGSAVPKLRVTNDDLSKLMDTSDEWIKSRTGIGARHLAVEETTTGLAVAAANDALRDAGVTAEELDLIIAATVTADKFLPNLSCEVQSALGQNAVAFDLNAACSGFLFALNTVQMYLENGVYKRHLSSVQRLFQRSWTGMTEVHVCCLGTAPGLQSLRRKMMGRKMVNRIIQAVNQILEGRSRMQKAKVIKAAS